MQQAIDIASFATGQESGARPAFALGWTAVPQAGGQLVATQPAPAQTSQTPVADDSAIAKQLIAAGNLSQARALLEARVVADPQDVESLFLLGIIAVSAKEYRQAIARFREALVYQPEATRIRLELARAFYLDKDYENAFRQFQFARADNPPAPVIAAIDRYLGAIRLEKNWSYSFSVAIAPDTNLNNATSARETELFGLPFELNDASRRHSGVGITAEGSAEIAPRIGPAVRFRLGLATQLREYGKSEFNDNAIALLAGPRVILTKWDLSLVGTGFRRWYGGQSLNDGLGMRVEAVRYLDPRTALTFTGSAQRITYPHAPEQSGYAYSASLGLSHALTAASNVSAQMGVNSVEAESNSLANWSWFGRVGYYRDLTGGFSIYVEPGLTRSTFDAPDPFFGRVRRDTQVEMHLSVLNRRIVVLSRFTPRFTYTFAHRGSNIDLYDFTQHRFEIGITSSF